MGKPQDIYKLKPHEIVDISDRQLGPARLTYMCKCGTWVMCKRKNSDYTPFVVSIKEWDAMPRAEKESA